MKDNELTDLQEQLDNKIEELRVTDILLESRERVLKAIPECPIHGAGCVPHAVEWVERIKSIAKMLGDQV